MLWSLVRFYPFGSFSDNISTERYDLVDVQAANGLARNKSLRKPVEAVSLVAVASLPSMIGTNLACVNPVASTLFK